MTYQSFIFLQFATIFPYCAAIKYNNQSDCTCEHNCKLGHLSHSQGLKTKYKRAIQWVWRLKKPLRVFRGMCPSQPFLPYHFLFPLVPHTFFVLRVLNCLSPNYSQGAWVVKTHFKAARQIADVIQATNYSNCP